MAIEVPTIELRPCPFCAQRGRYAVKLRHPGAHHCAVHCHACGTDGPSAAAEETLRAVELWNQRPLEFMPVPVTPSHYGRAIEAELARLRRVVDAARHIRNDAERDCDPEIYGEAMVELGKALEVIDLCDLRLPPCPPPAVP